MWLIPLACLSGCGGQYNLELLAERMEFGRNLTQEARDGSLPAYATTAAASPSTEQLVGVRDLQNSLAKKHKHIVLSGKKGADSLVYIEALAALTAPAKQTSRGAQETNSSGQESDQPQQEDQAQDTSSSSQANSSQTKTQSQKSLEGRTVIRVKMLDFVTHARELSLTPSQFLKLLRQVLTRSSQENSSPIIVMMVEEMPTLEEVRRFSGFRQDGLQELEFDRKLFDAVGATNYPVIWVKAKKHSARPLHELLKNRHYVEVKDLSAAQLYMLLDGEKRGRKILLSDDLLQMIVRVLLVHSGDQGFLELGLRVLNAFGEELGQNSQMTWQQQKRLCLRVLAPFLQTTIAVLEQSRAVKWIGTFQEFEADRLQNPDAHELIKLGPSELASSKIKQRTTIFRTAQLLRQLLLDAPDSLPDVLLQTMRNNLNTIDGAVQNLLPVLSKSSPEDRNIARLMASSLQDLTDEFDKNRNSSIKDLLANEVDRLKTANIAKLNSFVQ